MAHGSASEKCGLVFCLVFPLLTPLFGFFTQKLCYTSSINLKIGSLIFHAPPPPPKKKKTQKNFDFLLSLYLQGFVHFMIRDQGFDLGNTHKVQGGGWLPWTGPVRLQAYPWPVYLVLASCLPIHSRDFLSSSVHSVVWVTS